MDNLVYELYGLTEEEIRLVEESVSSSPHPNRVPVSGQRREGSFREGVTEGDYRCCALSNGYLSVEPF